MTQTLWKKDLIDAIYEELYGKHTKTAIKDIVEATFDTIVVECAKGNNIILRKVGTFKPTTRKGINPKTKESYISKSIKFYLSKEIRKQLNK